MSNLPPRFITVHAAATYSSMDIDAQWVRDIHVNQNGWKDIGYHYFIKRDGTVETGRPVDQIGAHTGGHNTKNIGVCMAGGLKQGTKNTPEDNFTAEQYSALNKILDDLLGKYPDAKLMGHNDFENHRSRGCPCFNQHAYFEWLQLARRAEYRPSDWFDHSKHDWHEHSPDAWEIAPTFYDEIDFVKSPDQK